MAQTIYNNTIRVIVDRLNKQHAVGILPKTRDKVLTLQGLLSFPYAFGAVDGCHLQIRCPIGEAARKDYWCFKQF